MIGANIELRKALLEQEKQKLFSRIPFMKETERELFLFLSPHLAKAIEHGSPEKLDLPQQLALGIALGVPYEIIKDIDTQGPLGTIIKDVSIILTRSFSPAINRKTGEWFELLTHSSDT